MEDSPVRSGLESKPDQSAAAKQTLDGVLVHELTKSDSEINRQPQSPLFSILPKEIRDYIWAYTLTAYEDPKWLYPKHLRCNRPGQGGALRIAKELLCTCKVVYLETYNLPILLNPISVHVGDHKDLPPGQLSGAAIINKLGNYQFANTQWLELSTQQIQLEDSAIRDFSIHIEAGRRFIEGLTTDRNYTIDEETHQRINRMTAWSHHSARLNQAHAPRPRHRLIPTSINNEQFGPRELARKFPARPITRLTVRLGRTDWWTWTSHPNSDDRLGLDPWINRPSYKTMELHAQHRRDGTPEEGPRPNEEWKYHEQWGMQVGCFPDLKLLELVFETFVQKLPQLDSVVECAKTWVFPLPQGVELRWDGKVESSSWTGVAPKEYGYHDKTPWLHGESEGNVDHDKPLEPKFEVRTVRYVRKKTGVAYKS
ncbi:hypothetical protein EV356DRAFT_519356 [Viridothelium virens]|uniref:Uncharacterized protein n=1 Tax=Viridothelium virens TaxID=1048519 RepID=A0A6A6GZ62_VIRVR|nr:hypothetical protein EV356DRAFT_519356 [Viridothelium virens]